MKHLIRIFTIILCGACVFMTTSCNSQKNNPLIDRTFFTKIYKEGFNIADDNTLATLDEYVEFMHNRVVESDSTYKVKKGATVYYFSEKGSSINDGLSPESPKESLEDLSYLSLKSGDVVLFERGSIFRGTIKAQSGVTYSAYGEGAKPIICGSRRNFADPALWKESDYENVYVCTQSINNAGNIVFDNSWTIGDYTQTLGNLKVLNLDGFKGAQELNKDLDFYCDINKRILYLYSDQGNPGERFDSIEICESGNLIDVTEKKNIIVDNLHLTLGGSHGVGATSAKNLTVRNCIFDWIGGSILQKTTRYGNAVECYVSSNGFYVYNNWIYQIYDTGITTQYSQNPSLKYNIMKNNEYYNNIIEYCFWSFEYYHKMSPGVERVTENIYVHDNYCRLGGNGWGRKGSGHMCCFVPSGEKIKDVVIENNIFDGGRAVLVSSYSGKSTEFDYNKNIYVKERDGLLARVEDTNYHMNDEALSVINDLVGDKKACVICIDK